MKLTITLASILVAVVVSTVAPGSLAANIGNGAAVASSVKDAGGVQITLSIGTMRLEPWGDGVIRVQYAPDTTLPGPATSSVLPLNRPIVDWQAKTDDPKEITLTTPKLRASVNRASGAVTFLDEHGNTLLEEPSEGGKSMSPATYYGQHFWKAQQTFLSPGDESLYGLGGYWHGFLDHKGDMVRLAQSNPCDVSPVLISSRGYAMLWDNGSTGNFQACKDPVAIPQAMFILPDGSGSGLKSEFYTNQLLAQKDLITSSTTPTVDAAWTRENPPHPSIKTGDFGVRWTGKIKTPEAGDYFFLLRTGWYGGRLIIDKRMIIENWIAHGGSYDTGHVSLAAGEHEIQVEFYGSAAHNSSIQLQWIPPGSPADRYSWSADAAKSIDYYVIRSSSVDEAVSGYRRLTGSAPMFPRSAYGFWHSQASWKGKPGIPNTEANLLAVASGYRERQLPIDNMVQDFQYWTKMGAHDFRRDTHPDPVKMQKTLKDEHYEFMISIWCIFQAGSLNHDEMLHKGFIFNPGSGQAWNDPFNPPSPSSQEWYDPWNPDARATYWRQVRDGLFNPGFLKADAFWMDSTEGVAAIWHANEYPLVASQAVYEGWRQADPAKRVTILGRSLFPGMQRYAVALWSGDIGTDMWSMAHQIPNGLGVCMTGLPYWTTDVGGFGGGFAASPEWSYRHDPNDPRYNETYVRWFQYGAFCPFFRVHTAGATSAPWEFGAASEAICKNYLNLRYRLMPYIYSLARRVTHEDYTIMRALPMDYMSDPKVRQITDQFMFGSALLVNPVTELGADRRDLYLPAGTWYDFWTGNTEAGARKISAAAPLERIPLYVRAGSILPMGPEMQYTSEKPEDPLEIRVYPGADGDFTLYDDDGKTYNYEKGDCSEIPIHWDNTKKTLAIGDRVGAYPGMIQHRTMRIVCVRKGTGVGETITDQADKTVAYDGTRVSVAF